MSRVVLAMSGGVDSSVAAHLLVEQGHDVIGVFMRHGEQSPVACEERGARSEEQESSPSSLLAPRSLARSITSKAAARRPTPRTPAAWPTSSAFRSTRSICRQEFGQIIDYFVAEYTAGRTPNPCVQCNNWIKFGKLFDYADSVGAEFVATGHYARLETRRRRRDRAAARRRCGEGSVVRAVRHSAASCCRG